MSEPSLLLDLAGSPWLDRVTSTQELCRELARRGAAEGTCVRARQQTAGQGRGGRAWHSPPGGGLYMSFLLRPSIDRVGWPSLTPLVALAAAEALEELAAEALEEPAPGAPEERPPETLEEPSPETPPASGHARWRVWIKWPNDLFGSRGKLGGILAEVIDAAVVVGLGINLWMEETEVPAELQGRASSLRMEGFGSRPDPEAVARAFNRRLTPLYARLQRGDRDFLRDGLLRRFYLRDARVVLASAGARLEGRLEGIARDLGPGGELILETPDGSRTVVGGEVIEYDRAPHHPGPPARRAS